MATKLEVLKSIRDKSIVLSHTSIKEFSETPSDFIRYKTMKKEPTRAMVNGSFEHAMILEPDSVDGRFFFEPKVNKASNDGRIELIYFYLDVCKKIGVFDELVKEGIGMPEGNQKEIIAKQGFFSNLCYDSIIDQKEYEFLHNLKIKIERNDAAGWLMAQTHTNEQHVKWKAFGYNWQGYIDSIGDNVIFDLKRVPDANPKKLTFTIRDRKFAWQAAHYTIGAGNEDKEYFILAFDGSMNITVIKITKEAIHKAWDEISHIMTQFKKCDFLGKWDASYDFYAPDYYYQF